MIKIIYKFLQVLLLSFLFIEPVYALDLFVSTNGSDNENGTYEKPLKTIKAARDKIRSLRANKKNKENIFIVNIRAGTYFINDSIALEKVDSGSINNHVIYRAYNNEDVRLTGGVDVDLAIFLDDQERNTLGNDNNYQVKYIKLSDIGVNGLSVFNWKRSDRNQTLPEPIAPEEVFIDSKPMTLARWPNEGWVTTQNVNNKSEFFFNNERIKKWESTAWLQGFWAWDWYDEALQLQATDPARNLVKLNGVHYYGLRKDKRFFVFNSNAELDYKNEYYIDRNTGTLYLIPEKIDFGQKVSISVNKNPLLYLNGAENLDIIGLKIGEVRDSGVHVKNSKNILLLRLVVRNTGNTGVYIAGGNNVVLKDSEIYNNGTRAVYVSGGDRKNLIASNHVIEYNNIHDYGRRIYAKSSGIEVRGVGQFIVNNVIKDAPHMGIYFFGNNHLISENKITNVCNKTSDSGAIYTGRDWSARGTIISKNFINNINGISNLSNPDVTAVYLDDFASGISIENNIISNSYRGIVVGGGRDNKIFRNLFYNDKIAVSVDGRGLTWARSSIEKGSELMNALESTPYKSILWKNKYPKLANILQDNPSLPLRNEVKENILYKTGDIKTDIVQKITLDIKDNIYTKENPGFKNPEINNFMPINEGGVDTIINSLPLADYSE